jgi:hypothetical protein
MGKDLALYPCPCPLSSALDVTRRDSFLNFAAGGHLRRALALLLRRRVQWQMRQWCISIGSLSRIRACLSSAGLCRSSTRTDRHPRTAVVFAFCLHLLIRICRML